jgi:hypothetical protein
MPISSIASNALSNSTISPLINNSATTDKTRTGTTPSTIVTLSAKAQQLSRGQSTSSQTQSAAPADTVAKQSLQAVPKESNEAPGIQLMQGQAKGGRISTYA